jgi:CubicO group peptidase (beta-lactamase class C family)
MAGLFTTVPDFARYMIFLQDAFPARDGPEAGPVKRATAREMQQLHRFEELAERASGTDTPWHAVAGYGYGLAIWHDDHLQHGVSHGGGLPGYGSYFYNLPNHGVGIVALTNKTYSRVGMIFSELLACLAQTGGLQPRKIAPSPELVTSARIVQNWLESGDETQLVANAADNFLLDHDMDHRRAGLAKVRAELGEFGMVSELEVLNALRGRWKIVCEKGTLEVFLTLAPTMPATIQMLRLTAIVA